MSSSPRSSLEQGAAATAAAGLSPRTEGAGAAIAASSPSTLGAGTTGSILGPLPQWDATAGFAAPPTPGSSNLAEHTHMLLTNPPPATADIPRSNYALPPASLTFKDVAFSLPARRSGSENVILEPCSGHFEDGQVVAIMGPSGCGKTTLLDILSDKKTSKYSGEVRVNGRLRDARFRRIAAYVGQEDLMPPHWKVREAIKFNATLKKQPSRTHYKVDAWINVLLSAFSLDDVAESMIGGIEVRGISGGQRRRVGLARGVAAHASLLFCDEPTSGLSATDAEVCIKALRIVAKRLGVLCLVVIHQPRQEVATLFDSLILLTSHPGRMAYSGPMSGAQAYWEQRQCPVPKNVNPTDFFLDILTPGTTWDHADEFVKAFDTFQKPALEERVRRALATPGASVEDMLATRSGEVVRMSRYAVPFGTQLSALLTRKLRLMLRNPLGLALPLLVPIVQGLVVGYMFHGIGDKGLLRQVMFVFCLLTMLCLAGTMSLIVLITDRTLMKHEVSEALYSEGAAALASVLVDVPLALLGACLNVFIMAGLGRLDSVVFRAVLVWALLLFFVYDSLFAFIGAVAKDTRQAQVVATPFISIFMLFNGFMVSRADSPTSLRWIFSVSPNAYAMEAITAVVLDRFEPFDLMEQMTKVNLEKQFPEPPKEAQGLAILLSMIIMLRIGQQLGLRYLNHIQR
mmetsp:Transcript_47371/g.138065  ORF Transcript_47371/g.138065 Transcript_47371/m.138065 type:complete len:686 (-) Transcript_47371:98-2155(-)